MRYGWMYSDSSPFPTTRFWKNELVGRGAESRLGEKKRRGFGTTVDLVAGKRNGVAGGPRDAANASHQKERDKKRKKHIDNAMIAVIFQLHGRERERERDVNR